MEDAGMSREETVGGVEGSQGSNEIPFCLIVRFDDADGVGLEGRSGNGAIDARGTLLFCLFFFFNEREGVGTSRSSPRKLCIDPRRSIRDTDLEIGWGLWAARCFNIRLIRNVLTLRGDCGSSTRSRSRVGVPDTELSGPSSADGCE